MPRGSGIAPQNEEERKKELKKIDAYKNLVDSVTEEVGVISLNESYLGLNS